MDINDAEIILTTNTEQKTDNIHKQNHSNATELKSASNKKVKDHHRLENHFNDTQLNSATTANLDLNELQLSLNSTNHLSSETIQIIQNTVAEYGLNNASPSTSLNKEEDSVENDATTLESIDAEMRDQTTTERETDCAPARDTTPGGVLGERSSPPQMEHNADNDEDYMDSSALAANYVPYTEASLTRDNTSSASLPCSLLEDDDDIHVTFSDMIHVSVCKPEVKISKPKPSAVPPVKSHIVHIRKRHPKPQPHVKPTPRTTFPSIKAKQTSSDVEEHATTHEPKTEEHPAQSRQWAKVKSQRFRLPSLQAHADAAMTSGLAAQAREDISKVATNIEEMNFRSEQYQERLATYDHKGFIQPRIVLVSSKVPRCNSMKRAIRKENNVQFIVYDFDKWSFNDILDAVSDRLNSYHRGCKAHSVLLLCQGGNGYAYLLKNFVLTPQKVKRVDYKPLREFWFDLGALISKIKPEEALIYIVGCVSDVDKQGRDLLNALRKLIYPLRVQIESPQEGTEQGKVALKQYFHYRRFLLWRSFMDGNDQNAELDPLRSRIDTERIMTWAELAEDADSD
ncbi:NMDA receptor synaptonuclear signaling and neuronal migration factor-like isoform X1 [Gigantopelta aegis]|uniref:NMDA receptor synaptonuclear signaling and neuronal migration factor-like isoform X1 n=1 Tax=Gigantopelta aegis TaxID=1735272 RepID=UPI001B88DE5F|nr:NMDA receptor synaptonuclear signaling and neuronal migration factor-like isoform X1 [Gigantopelta aegis]